MELGAAHLASARGGVPLLLEGIWGASPRKLCQNLRPFGGISTYFEPNWIYFEIPEYDRVMFTQIYYSSLWSRDLDVRTCMRAWTMFGSVVRHWVFE